jgi:hypothetical protein
MKLWTSLSYNNDVFFLKQKKIFINRCLNWNVTPFFCANKINIHVTIYVKKLS